MAHPGGCVVMEGPDERGTAVADISLDRATAWVHKVRHNHPEAMVIRWTMRLNNYYDSRQHIARGYGVEYLVSGGGTGWTLWRDDMADPGSAKYVELTDAHYLVDNGRTVTPCFTAGTGRGQESHAVFVQSFTPDPDDGIPSFGPRMAYAVSVRGI